MDLHVVEVEVLVEWEDDDRVIELMEALTVHPELLDAAVGADLHRRGIGVTVTVKAADPATARAIAERVLEEEVATLGFTRLGERRPLSFEAARGDQMEARKEEALEAMARGLAHSATVEAVLDWDDQERLGERLGELLAARMRAPSSSGRRCAPTWASA